jgi:protein-disulfide isomerase
MTAQAPSSIPAGATAAGDGIAIGDGPVTVDAYIDFLCPFCREFEVSSGPTLNAMAAKGAGCAADQGKFLEYTHALFASQPPEGGAGLDDAELIQLGISVGLTDEAFGSCVRAGRYLYWPQQVTDAATTRGVSGTPTVLVNGRPVAADARSIAAAAGVTQGEEG